MPVPLLRLLLLGLLAPLARGFKLSAPGPGRRLQESCGSTIGGGLLGGGEPFGTSCDDSCSDSCDTKTISSSGRPSIQRHSSAQRPCTCARGWVKG